MISDIFPLKYVFAVADIVVTGGEPDVALEIAAPTDIGAERLFENEVGVLLVMVCLAELIYSCAELFSRIKEMICDEEVGKVVVAVVCDVVLAKSILLS